MSYRSATWILALVCCLPLPARATAPQVELTEILDFRWVGGEIRSVDHLVLDGGALAVAYIADDEAAIGDSLAVFRPGDEPVDVLTGAGVPGASAGCTNVAICEFERGAVYFLCGSTEDASVDGLYMWRDGTTSSLVRWDGGTGMPDVAEPINGYTCGGDGTAVDGDDFYFWVYGHDSGDTLFRARGGNVVRLLDAHSAFPGETEPAFTGGMVLADSGSIATRWYFPPLRAAVFVDRGVGLERWLDEETPVPASEDTFETMDEFDLTGGRLRVWGGGVRQSDYHHGIYEVDSEGVDVLVDVRTVDPVTGEPFIDIADERHTPIAGTGNNLAFLATPRGEPPSRGLYLWHGSQVSLLARPGSVLPGSSEPVNRVTTVRGSGELVVFEVRYAETTDWSLYAHHRGETVHLLSRGDELGGRTAVLAEVLQRGTDRNQSAFTVLYEDGGSSLHLATVPEPSQRLLHLGAVGAIALLVRSSRQARRWNDLGRVRAA